LQTKGAEKEQAKFTKVKVPNIGGGRGRVEPFNIAVVPTRQQSGSNYFQRDQEHTRKKKSGHEEGKNDREGKQTSAGGSMAEKNFKPTEKKLPRGR